MKVNDCVARKTFSSLGTIWTHLTHVQLETTTVASAARFDTEVGQWCLASDGCCRPKPHMSDSSYANAPHWTHRKLTPKRQIIPLKKFYVLDDEFERQSRSSILSLLVFHVFTSILHGSLLAKAASWMWNWYQYVMNAAPSPIWTVTNAGADEL